MLIINAEGRIRSHPVNAYITMCNKGSCLQFHMSSPCALLFHGLAVFIKWDIILNKWFKHFTILLLITRLNVRTFGSWLSNKKNVRLDSYFIQPVCKYTDCDLLQITINRMANVIKIQRDFTLKGRKLTSLQHAAGQNEGKWDKL